MEVYPIFFGLRKNMSGQKRSAEQFPGDLGDYPYPSWRPKKGAHHWRSDGEKFTVVIPKKYNIDPGKPAAEVSQT